MSRVLTITGDVNVAGQLSAETMSLPAASVSNATVQTNAGIEAVKVIHLIVRGTDFGIAGDAAPSADVRKVLFVASGACTIRLFKASLRDTGTSSGITFDLLKAPVGSATLTTVLSAALSFTHADTDNTPKSATLSSTTLVAGDMLVAFMDYTSATGVLGPWAWVEISEGAN